ncbi:hypothetical protein ACN27E_07875 [Mycobacterium sp. WMMD1722]|uniref:hypothetical protein n=1 Tax=Mycobacterium sp. WMMD1722 TaxID=3404117 RepID=UPI003BF5408E
MIRDLSGMVHLRWRAAQLLLAVSEGHHEQAQALSRAAAIEGLDADDMRDELRLLIRQFRHRALVVLREEIHRLASKLGVRS